MMLPLRSANELLVSWHFQLQNPAIVCLHHVCLYVCARFYIFWGSENRCLCYGFAAELYWLECYTWQEREEESIQHILWILSGSGKRSDLLWPIMLRCLSNRLLQTPAALFCPSVQLVEAGWLTNGWTYACPMTSYQTDHATFISLTKRAATFWDSQVEDTDSSFAIYC